MDESYLEWLRSLPGFTVEKARKVSKRFPTFEHLRHATREELASVPGLTPADMDVLRRTSNSFDGRDESGHLFLCPECGSFAGPSAKSCPFCGVDFAEAENGPGLEGLDEFLREAESPAALCVQCGAILGKEASRCPICDREYTSEERALLPGLGPDLERATRFCSHCGAYLSPETAECTICGFEKLREPAPATNGRNGKGIGHGFLSRWQHVAEVAPQTERERLHEELEHCDRLLEADPNLGRVWAKRGRLLAEIGRAIDAAESLAKAAELDPSKDEAYRVEVLDILEAKGDMSFLPHRWRQPSATAAPATLDPRLLEALSHYDALTREDPNLLVAWRTKGEILERLGREAEARESFERAKRLEHREGEALKASLSGLQTRAPTGALPPAARGSRGRTNGRVNGRGNGRTNGFSEGRVNGLTNGAVNGIGLSRGAVNGLGGLTQGVGRTNGLVNGNGFTNGRRGRYTPRRIPTQPHWARSLVGIAAVVALMVLVPVLASFLSPSPGVASPIQIDRIFGDWSALTAYANAPPETFDNPDINILFVKVTTDAYGNLYVYARVQGLLFQAAWTNGTESILVFVDEDGSAGTGYPIGDLGADLLGVVSGWDNRIQTMTRYDFDVSSGPTSDDFRRFNASGSMQAAASNGEVEMAIPVDANPAQARILVYGADNLGHRSAMVGVIQPARATVVVEQRTVAPAVISNTTAAILRVNLSAVGGSPWITGMNLTRRGTSPDPVDVSAYRDNGDGRFEGSDVLLGRVTVTGAWARVPISLNLTAAATVWVLAEFASLTPERTFGLQVDGLTGNGTASLRPPETTLDYLAGAPTSPTVDGAFGDWAGRSYGTDVLGDVVNRSGNFLYNANVDLLATATDLGVNLTGFAQVDGRILGGQDIPADVPRPYPSTGPGPVNVTAPYLPQEGVDVLYAYVDADNSTLTGAWTVIENRTYGFDNVIAVTGRNGVIISGGLYAYAPASNVSWAYLAPVAAAPDAHRIEFEANATSMSLVAGYRVLFFATDWRLQYDIALPDAAVQPFVLASLAAATHVVINEVSPSPNPEWIEVANPTTSSVDLEGWTLSVRRGGGNVVIYTFRGVVLGPFGSGTDLFVAVPPSNSLPNGATRISLNNGPAVVDTTRYPGNLGGTRTWSRYKDPVTGQPGTNAAGTDFYRSTLPSQGQPNDRTRPIISLTKAASATTRIPGNTLTYTIRYDNTGDGLAKYVWINDTLPSGVTFLSSSAPPSSITNSTYGWVFTDVPRNSRNTLTIRVQVNGLGADGSRQVNRATLAYTDQIRRIMGTGQAWANFTVRRPTIVVEKTVSPSSAVPGQAVTYRIYYNNTGSRNAGTVSIKDVLPNGIVYVSANPAPTAIRGQNLYWNFTNVAPGPHSILLRARVSSGATGSELVNWVYLNYTSTNGYALSGSEDSAVLAIPELGDFFFVGLVPFLILGLRARARRRRAQEKEEGVADSVPWTDGR
ncbi:MAG TPA: lamin tail domain-containing protein [Thermoplasmata archaeon]